MSQAFALSGAMAEARVERVVSSPLRCIATAKPVADRLNVLVETDDRLIEIGHGTWEGRLRDEVALVDAQRRALDAFWDPPVENGTFVAFDVDGERWTLIEPSLLP